MRAIKRVVSDYKDTRYVAMPFHEFTRGQYVFHFVVPSILGISDIVVTKSVRWKVRPDTREIPSSSIPRDERAKHPDWIKYDEQGSASIDIYSFMVCLGNDFVIDSMMLYFHSKTRAEVCRDDILDAIDEYYREVNS